VELRIPDFSLVVLIGASGSGKSTFAARHFLDTEVVSSDACRGLVADDPNDQTATGPAFELLHFIAARRLEGRRLTVVDATNVQPEARKPLVALARQFHALPVAIVLDIPRRICEERNTGREDRSFGSRVIRQQASQLRQSLRGLNREGFRFIYRLGSPEEVEGVEIQRQPLWCDRRRETGPFDIIGDVHGCFDELVSLLETLGYEVNPAPPGLTEARSRLRHPEGRRVIFLGDLVDRGPRIPEVLGLAMDAVQDGAAFCIPGNHDVKLLKKLRGRDVQVKHGLAASIEQLERMPDPFRARVESFLDSLISHYVLDGGKLVVAHAGLSEKLQGRGSARVREFCLYGETTGETDEFGLPVRYRWAADYRGDAQVVYGHTPVPEPDWLNRTVNIDTGCVFGGRLTAFRYPEGETVSVPAARVYSEPVKPLAGTPGAGTEVERSEGPLLNIEDVLGKRIIATRLRSNVTVREQNSRAALEVMSRFAVHPGWLVYLPPTMSPAETSSLPGLLEHPAEAFGYYRGNGVARLVCEEKHMGSRVVVVLCRTDEVARERFGVPLEGRGVCYTRTGRRFFNEPGRESAVLDRIATALDRTGFWSAFDTGWVVLDCELMPWSAKARSLLREQYAAVGAAARCAISRAVSVLDQAVRRAESARPLRDRYRSRRREVDRYVDAYRRYCWPVDSLDDFRLAPFHVLATEGIVHQDKNHIWHMEELKKLCATDPDWLIPTPYRVVDVEDTQSVANGVGWWEALTAEGGEGMVVKPLDFVARGRRGIVQPAVKCRGREYLRIIYGPEYAEPEHLDRLRMRGLSTKRSLALREFALGIEALERFVRREPLNRVHECVFGVLALESEPVDPRL